MTTEQQQHIEALQRENYILRVDNIALLKDREQLIERCYLAARGTDNLADNRFTRSQSYWKGRADAANDVRALKGKKQ